MFIWSIYRAPDAPLPNFIDTLNSKITILPQDAEIILLGDFNVNVLAKRNTPSQWRSQPKMFGPASSAAGARVVGGSGGILPRKILKTRTAEMPFPAIWALTYENQFH